jgi:hypothetical protein
MYSFFFKLHFWKKPAGRVLESAHFVRRLSGAISQPAKTDRSPRASPRPICDTRAAADSEKSPRKIASIPHHFSERL